MATEEQDMAMEIAPDPTATVSAEDKPVEKLAKFKKANETKEKKTAASRKPRLTRTHPTYEEMIKDAIVSLKERSGSSQYAVTKFIEEKHKQLPPTYKKLTLNHLKKLVAAGKLVKVKGSFKLPAARVKPAGASEKKLEAPKGKSKPKPKAKVAVAARKKKTKPATKSKAPKVVVKAKVPVKAKAVSKVKAAATAKTKAVTKPKDSAKSTPPAKSKRTERPAKVARTSTRTTPGKKVAAPSKATIAKKASVKKLPVKKLSVNKTPVKKAPSKGVKLRTVRSPAKRTMTRRGKK